MLLDGDTIAAAGSGAGAPDADETVDLGGATVVPGFVDLHGHGGGGHAYDDGGTELAAALAVASRARHDARASSAWWRTRWPSCGSASPRSPS